LQVIRGLIFSAAAGWLADCSSSSTEKKA